ncbi:nuclear pore complex protein DDB_G0274915 [Astyanax mexicanus]|uniref:nuclear pore complex protein DDB_G0274915 n=1 Tax=Astyanax mexicanus TaxID=7994 RepID=UPI0020CB3398|nr:nuclear pore complex protein DDB_G0274915 [Astyanax mexicanus]
MVLSRNSLHCLFLALFLWESANGLGVWQKRPANYWQSRDGSKDPGGQALSPAQQDFSSSASGVQTAVYDVGSAQPLSTSGSGGSATTFLGFLRQYTISSDQNVPNQYSPLPQSQGGYTAQPSVSLGNQPAPGFQSQQLSAPVFPSQGSASQSLGSQQSSLQLASPGPVVSSPPLQFVVPGTQTLSPSPGTSSLSSMSAFATTSQQGSYDSQSAASSLYGQPPSWYSPSQGQSSQTSFQSQTSMYKPVTLSQASASQSPSFQQASSQLASPSLSLTTSYAPGAQPLSPGTSSLSSTSTFATTPQQATYGSQSATGMLHGLASSVNPSQFAKALNQPAVVVIDAYTAGPVQWYRIDPFRQTIQTSMPLSPSQALGSQGSQAASSSSLSTSQIQSTTGPIGFGFQSQSAPASTVALTQGAAQLPSFQAPSGFSSTPFSAASPSASVSQPTQGIQSSATLSSSSVSTSQTQSTSGSSGFGFQSQSTPVSTGFQSQLVSSPVSPVQGSASQSLASQQSSLQLGSSSQATSSLPLSFTAGYVPGSQAQPSSSATSSLSSASATSSQQASYGSQSVTGAQYGQGKMSPYKPLSASQGSAPMSIASQQGSLQLASPSLSLTTSYAPETQSQPLSPATSSLSSASPTTSQQTSYGSQTAAGSLASQQSSLQFGSSQPLSFTASYAPETQSQPSSPATSSLISASPTTAQQTSSGSQSATGTLYGQPSSLYSSSQGQNIQVPTQSADAPYKPALGAYTAGPAQWYRFDPFGQTSQINKPFPQSQASGSQGSQATSSSSTTTSQTQSTTGSVGFGFQSQSAPAPTVGLTQSAAQAPSFQAPSGFSSMSFSASSPSASVSQPSQGIQSSVTWTSPVVSTSFGQDIPVAITQQYSWDALQVTGASSSLPSQVPSTSQTSGNYGSAFQSSTTQVGSFDQYNPASSTFTSAQGTPISFGLAQDYGTLSFSASGRPQTAVSSPLNQATPEAQSGSSVYGDSLSFSSFERPGSTSFSFAQDLNSPVFKPATRRRQDTSVKH